VSEGGKIEETWSRIEDKVDEIVAHQGSRIILNRTGRIMN
jgi:hypothetical protein